MADTEKTTSRPPSPLHRDDKVVPPQTNASSDSSNDEGIYVVDWEGPTDPANPKNWPVRKKWAITVVVSAYTLLSPLSSAMMAPAGDIIAAQFGVTNSSVSALLTSIFVLGYVFGPLLLGPLSEVYGRARVLQAANFWYLAWNFGCAFAQNIGEMLVFRLLAGLGGSGTLTIGGGVLGDVWTAEQRGQAVSLYSLMPILGPVIGPLCGAWIAQLGDWRWVFWAPTIFSVAVQLVGLWFLKESDSDCPSAYAPVLLERKAAAIRKKNDLEGGCHKEIKTTYYDPHKSWKTFVNKSLFRPFAMFFREPIIQVMAAYMSLLYGTLYLYLTTIPSIFQGLYRQPIGISGLHYIAFGIGLAVAAQVNARAIDRVYKYLCQRNDGVGKPEFRLPCMVPGTFLLPIGLLITGWTSRSDIPWIAPDIGIALVGAGMVLNLQTIQTYLIDAFTLYAASALAAATFFRSLAGFGFPLFAPAMFSSLGYGKGDTVLAAVAIVVGILRAPFLFWKYGERLRNASRYAKR
ncbi:MFS polyamine transporter [Epithele typhae]|uniref:MFS polyamine transporter n=1 Tax=Epithele typhae TaxID=378194 RepID=UPI0020088B18|nr:MFS polyamine transporter [Epithele typhae]KAH9929016.1 MFS polyamine transporter [Epithele typhae]